MDYVNLGKTKYDWTKAYIAGVGNGHGLHKAETDIDQVIQLESSHEASDLYGTACTCSVFVKIRPRSLRRDRWTDR